MYHRVVGGTEWGHVIFCALDEIKDQFVAWQGYLFEKWKEFPLIDGIRKEYSDSTCADEYTLSMHKDSGWWFWRKHAKRNVLRVIDDAIPKQRPSLVERYDISGGNCQTLIRYNGSEPLKCELFWNHLRLRAIAQHILDPVAKRLGYARVEYIDMSHDGSAWYPDEHRQQLPKARVLKY